MAGILDILKTLAPIALQYGGYKLKQSVQEDARKQRNQVIQAMQGINTDATRQLVDTTRNNVQQYAPQRRMPALEDQERQAVRRLVTDVSVAPEAVSDGPVYAGKTSGRYDAAKAKRAADELRYATRLAGIMGRAAAPAELSLREGFSNTDAALDRARTRSNVRGDLDVQQLALGEVAPSSGRLFGGDAMQAAGLYLNRKNTDARGAASMARAWGAQR